MPRGQEEGCGWTEILGTPGHSENELKMATIRRAQKQKELTSKWVMTTTFLVKMESGCLLKRSVGPILGGHFLDQYLSL